MDKEIIEGSNHLKTFNIDLNFPELDIWVDFLHVYTYKPHETFSFHAHQNIEFHYYASGEGEVAFLDDQFLPIELITLPATVKSKKDPNLMEFQFGSANPNLLNNKTKLYQLKVGSVFFNCPGQFCWQKSSGHNPLIEYAMRFSFNIKSTENPVNQYFIKEYKLIQQLLSQNIVNVFDDKGEIKGIYETIFREAYYRKPAFLVRIKNELINLIVAYARLAWDQSKLSYFVPESDGTQKRLSMIDDYILSNIGANITLEQLSKNANMSERNLSRFIKERKGVTVHQYIMQFRIAKAVNLIKTNAYTQTEIASITGFSSPFHFSKCIKRYTGKNPSEL
jgi:AraC-like DNA-binding protein